MKKFLLVTLLIFISCGPTEEEIQARIDGAIEETLLDIENENVNICFLIVDNQKGIQKNNPSLTVTDFENKIVDFTLAPKWNSEGIYFYGNLNEFNDKKLNHSIYTVSYVLNIPKNARYLKIYVDYRNSNISNWWYEWDKDRIEKISETQFFNHYRIGREGEDFNNLLTNEDFQSNWKSVKDKCEQFVKSEA